MAEIGTGVIILIVIWLITIVISLLLLAIPKARCVFVRTCCNVIIMWMC